MPTYQITSPDGRKFKVTAPDGATKEDALKYVMANQAKQPEMPEEEIPMAQAHTTEQPKASILGRAAKNFIPSSINLAKGAYETIKNPQDTLMAIASLPEAFISKAIPGEQGKEKYADAIIDQVKKWKNPGEYIAEDPAAALTDVSSLLMGGGALLAKAPKFAKAGQIASKIGSAIDPMANMVRVPVAAGKGIANVAAHTLGTTSGAGGEAVKAAAKSGFKGGEYGKAFRENIRGGANIADMVDDAKSAVEVMRQERSAAYNASMSKIKTDKTVLDFAPIEKAVKEAENIGRFQGKNISKSTSGVWDKIKETVDDWRGANPADFHTPEGLDALKRAIGDIRDATDHGTPSRVVADRVFSSVKQQIEKQAPAYARTMKDYADASAIIKDIEKTLSVKPGANVDTSIRKLQSIMRNNVNTTYGRRVDLAQTLASHGAGNLMPKIAGQALSSATPRGLQALGATGAGVAALATNPQLLPYLAVTSPRVVGEASYYAGKASKPLSIPLGLLMQRGIPNVLAQTHKMTGDK